MRNAYEILVGEPEWKRLLEDLDVDGRLKLERILVWEDVDWMHLVQDKD
jgi:hypothetical protein